MIDPFDEKDYYTGPQLTMSDVHRAEEALGYSLPSTYVQLLMHKNGGSLKSNLFATPFSTSWSDNHFKVRALYGIGGEWAIDSSDGSGSADLIEEWGYPKIGVVICLTPSGGHDTVMLDYSESGPEGEPSVAYIDEDRVPRRIADTFESFIAGLTSSIDGD